MQKLIVYIYIRHHLNSIIISCKDDTESRHSNCISNFHYYFSSKKVWKKNQTNSNLTSQRIPLQCRKKLSVFETSGLPTLITYSSWGMSGIRGPRAPNLSARVGQLPNTTSLCQPLNRRETAGPQTATKCFRTSGTR